MFQQNFQHIKIPPTINPLPGLTACIIILVVSCISFTNCSETEPILEASSSPNLSARSGDFLPTGLILPEGTTTNIEGDRLSFSLPDEYQILGSTSGTVWAIASGGDVTCTCTDGDGGSAPVLVRGTAGCFMDECNECLKTVSIKGDDSEFEYLDYSIIRPELFEILGSFQQLEGLRLAPASVMQTPVMVEMLDIVEDLMSGSEEPDVRKYVFANLLGMAVLLDVPADLDNVSVALAVPSGGKISCSCNTEGECEAEGYGPAKWCDATNCKSCTMHGAGIVGPDGSTGILSLDANGVITIE